MRARARATMFHEPFKMKIAIAFQDNAEDGMGRLDLYPFGK